MITVPFNSLYHATKWALEGWSESMAFELNQLGIGMKIIEPGGMKTDFFTRSLDVGRHPAYDVLLDSVMGAITDPRQMATYSAPEQIAEVVYEAATDGKDQLRYVAGADAKATYAMRLQLGDEAFRKAIGNSSSDRARGREARAGGRSRSEKLDTRTEMDGRRIATTPLSPRLSLRRAQQRVQSQPQPTRSVCEAEESERFPKKIGDVREADFRSANRRTGRFQAVANISGLQD